MNKNHDITSSYGEGYDKGSSEERKRFFDILYKHQCLYGSSGPVHDALLLLENDLLGNLDENLKFRKDG